MTWLAIAFPFDNGWWYLLTIAFAIVTVLFGLNTDLLGRWKHYIDAVLVALWMILLALLFIFFGWVVGLLSAVGGIVLIAVVMPFSKRLLNFV